MRLRTDHRYRSVTVASAFHARCRECEPPSLKAMRLLFLGTGASGGTPGHGRSRRLESSLLICDRATLLIDVTRDFAIQAERLTRIDAVALTHAHPDAIGGLPRLRRWWLANRAPEPIAVFLSEATATRHPHALPAPRPLPPARHSSRGHPPRRAARLELRDRPARPGSSLPHVRLARFRGRTIDRVRLRRRPPDTRAKAVLGGRDDPRPRRSDVAPAAVLASDHRRDAANRLLVGGQLDHPHPDRRQRSTSRPASARGRGPLLEGTCCPRWSLGEDLNAGREGGYACPAAYRLTWLDCEPLLADPLNLGLGAVFG